MGNPDTWRCQNCGNVGLEDGDDGFFYCTQCNSQAEDFMDTGVADEDFLDQTGNPYGGLYSARHTRRVNSSVVKAEPLSQPLDDFSPYYEPFSQSQAKTEDQDPTGLKDFAFDGRENDEDYYGWIRLRYVMGLQRMIELQCEALVTEFKVTPLICGLAGTVWLRFLAGTQVLNDDCADHSFDLNESEIPQQGEPLDKLKTPLKSHAPNYAKYDPQALKAWFKSLKKIIPLSYTLAVSFLACHLAREAVLPTDMVKWSLEGKLPYFAAFLEIKDDLKQFGQPSRACPISSSLMFRPSESVPVQKLESLAASVAGFIGLDLPPVNFYAIASRFLNKLALPVKKILPHACRIYEWLMPPELWLSTNELRLPTRVCVMSILIVAVRILYNIHGFGEWERSLSSCHDSSSISKNSGDEDPRSSCEIKDDANTYSDSLPRSKDDSDTNFDRDYSHAENTKLDTAKLLANLEASYNEIADDYEYCKDLQTYLQFCKDIVFARSEPSRKDAKEEKLIETLWNYYQSGKDSDAAAEQGLHCGRTDDQKRPRYNEECSSSPCREKKFRRPSSCEETFLEDDHQNSQNGDHFGDSSHDSKNSEVNDQGSAETFKNEAINRMKLDMEEKRFCYIPPRKNPKRFDYLHYVRKQDDGAYTYVAHADYYIMLRTCSRVAQVEIRCMHIGVLSFERRLAWLEKRIDHCLHLTPPIISCEYCTERVPENTTDAETTDMVPENTTDADTIVEESIGLSNLNI
ncbi:PREDICTED: TATA box-binding protein-associated factor RNA polymerase I subunit B-like [Fragaria vesca subsp. vesca]|uniref:TATA box-binding protein-associated factor RNA polymerase I subunit B isoform X1 n=1 Tax=Fragaria vesca subsp. vesca TaxID=101020 RepID=UPI0002C2F088|nr:PREDICTED: TATA box-binding protein-associated factor RNA polymerase I subunit B isoform X1 [Fragaria vesca subsp. vesca]XP_011459263.1 PREDICTED: TATA box-binding protein-associated factor RNA polymerase I subunit B isoform X1 [Fragaria vesca subsp. vesca]XP_011459264.1 PREDICTED: TATA box-binding protein-associated factor RNA polymerase I subunit B isoform X1 [Fragaria vesca subsp. vesca]XP_011459265.1 PREDICTED: TATA box-binding protein-associated factor RNA polymerase I subunit B isoform 